MSDGYEIVDNIRERNHSWKFDINVFAKEEKSKEN